MNIIACNSNKIRSTSEVVDVLENIFRYLSPKEASKAVVVCKLWQMVFLAAPHMSDFVLQKGLVERSYRSKVVSEIGPNVAYPKGLIKILHQNGLMVSTLPMGKIENGYQTVGYDKLLFPIAVVRSPERENSPAIERILFRVIGSPAPLQLMFDQRALGLMQQVKGVVSIFQRDLERTWSADVYCLDLNPRMEGWGGSAGLGVHIVPLSAIVSNPISLIWLFCSGENTAYIDLLRYIPVPNTTLTLY